MLVTRHLGQWRESQPRWANCRRRLSGALGRGTILRHVVCRMLWRQRGRLNLRSDARDVCCEDLRAHRGISYDAVGYVSPRLKREEAASARAARKATGVHAQLKKVRVQLAPSLAYLTCLLISTRLLNGYPHHITSQVHTLVEYALELCRSRSTAIGGLAPDGGNGSFNRHTLGGLKYSVSNVAHVLNDLEARGVSTDSISLYAMFN